MNLRIAACAGGLLTIVLNVVAAQAQEGLPTLDEALAISQKTGRPILAMAGRKT